MAKLIYEAEYEDGTVQQIKVRPKHMVAFEEEFGEIGEDAKSTFRLAWTASGSTAPFEKWLDSLEALGVPQKLEDGGDGGPAERPTKRSSRTSQ